MQVMDIIFLKMHKIMVYIQFKFGNLSPKVVAAASIYISLKKLQTIYKDVVLATILNKLMGYVGLTADELLAVS